ncbi:MAG: glycosyltransferase family 2 protein [Gammaproteobacteria bacterium]
MTFLVRDEEDVLRANMEFHLAQGVDFILVTDNKSEDSTPDIIREYESAGVARYIYEGDDDYNQSAWVTRMAKLAATEYSADWVINNDADEFWWPREGNLKECFAAVPDQFNIVVGERHDFVPLVEEHGSFLDDMVFRKKVSLNTIGKPLPPKVAHRGDPEVLVQQGNHWAELQNGEQIIEEVLDIFHFPIRRYAQFTNKIVNGGQAYERNTTHNAQVGKTWRTLYKEYQKNGLKDFYRKQSMSAKQLEKGLRSGELIMDRRLSDFLAQPQIAARLQEAPAA